MAETPARISPDSVHGQVCWRQQRVPRPALLWVSIALVQKGGGAGGFLHATEAPRPQWLDLASRRAVDSERTRYGSLVEWGLGASCGMTSPLEPRGFLDADRSRLDQHPVRSPLVCQKGRSIAEEHQR
jgi:hypothetical protein